MSQELMSRCEHCEQVTTAERFVRLTCDRCGVSIDLPMAEVPVHWSRLSSANIVQYELCETCTTEHDRFLKGARLCP
jgi:hypothetical protein